MAKRINYRIGDIFQIVLDADGNFGYGRILLLDKPSIFIELYKLTPTTSKFDINSVKEFQTLFSVWSTDNGIKKGEWSIIGNLPVEEDVKIPDFWTTDAFSGKVLLIRGNERIEISRDEIGDLSQAGIYGHGAVTLAYVSKLKAKGLYS
jgi:hypothetical protein